MTFDTKTQEELKSYVYALIDPRDAKPFYIGKGNGNRVFDHVACALKEEVKNNKYEKIREIKSNGLSVKHVVIRHGMTDKTAFEVESSLIDFIGYLDSFSLTNKVLGHNSIDCGLMTANEIIRKYNAESLDELLDPVIIININKRYRRAKEEGIYEATKESWVIGKHRHKTTKYALSEYRGLIVEVYKIKDWYPVDTVDKNGKPKIRWGFNGDVAESNIRERYLNKSVAHIKRRGAANPIRYSL
jgi:hypothetical protein